MDNGLLKATVAVTQLHQSGLSQPCFILPLPSYLHAPTQPLHILKQIPDVISKLVFGCCFFFFLLMDNQNIWSFPGGSDGKESVHNAGERPRFDPWVRKIPWRREWLPTLVFLPGESHRQRSLRGSSKDSDTTERLTHRIALKNLTMVL